MPQNEIDNEMEYDPQIITLEDDEGNLHQFEILDRIEHNEVEYIAVLEYFEEPEKVLEEPIIILFRVGEPDEEGLETFDIVDDDEEYFEIGGIFAKRLELDE